MKLVRKNDEFIVIESRGSYHKVGLSEIDDLIILLCEAKRVDPAKANKSIGENLFEEQERCTRLAMQYVNDLHLKYGRVRQLMGIPMTDIYAKLKELAAEHRKKNSLDDDDQFDGWVDAALDSREIKRTEPFGQFQLEHTDNMVVIQEPSTEAIELMDKWVNTNRYPTYPLTRPCDVVLAIDPSTKGDMTMTITKGREKSLDVSPNANGQVHQGDNNTHPFYGDIPFVPPLEKAGVSFSIRAPLKQETMTPLKQAMIKTFEEQLPGRVKESFCPFGEPKRTIIDMLDMPRIPRQHHKSDLRGYLLRQGQWYRPSGSPLRNPLIGGKRIRQSHWPVPAVVYWPVLAAFNERMRRQDEARYVATAFPRRFNASRHKLPGTLYTADVAYFVLTGNPNEDITSMSQIQSKAVKAWEC